VRRRAGPRGRARGLAGGRPGRGLLGRLGRGHGAGLSGAPARRLWRSAGRHTAHETENRTRVQAQWVGVSCVRRRTEVMVRSV